MIHGLLVSLISVAVDRRGDRDRGGAGQRAAERLAERLPGESGGWHVRRSSASPARRARRRGHPRPRRWRSGHGCRRYRPRRLSMLIRSPSPPAARDRALFGFVRRLAAQQANSSRPMPFGRRAAPRHAGARGPFVPDRPAPASSPVSASTRMMSPSRTLPIGPPPSASGEQWIAHGTLPLAPDMRPSVTSATRKPRFWSTPSGGRQLVQLGHAVGARPLEADDDDDVAVELAGLERGLHRRPGRRRRAPAPRSSSDRARPRSP